MKEHASATYYKELARACPNVSRVFALAPKGHRHSLVVHRSITKFRENKTESVLTSLLYDAKEEEFIDHGQHPMAMADAKAISISPSGRFRLIFRDAKIGEAKKTKIEVWDEAGLFEEIDVSDKHGDLSAER